MIMHGDCKTVFTLIESGTTMDWFFEGVCTALHMASQQGHHDVVAILIHAGADVNLATTDEYADSPLILAAQNGHVECVDYLIKAGANVNYARRCQTIRKTMDRFRHY